MCFCCYSKIATVVEACHDISMRDPSEEIQTSDSQKITEEEAGSSTSTILMSGTKNTTILYARNPDTQTDGAMKVHFVALVDVLNVNINKHFSISCIA